MNNVVKKFNGSKLNRRSKDNEILNNNAIE